MPGTHKGQNAIVSATHWKELHGTLDVAIDVPVALYTGSGGDIACVGADGVAVTFPAVPAGSILPVQPQQINSSGTTATNIIGLYNES